jgi:hypothetical protein
MKQIVSLIRRNPYAQFVLVAMLVLSVYVATHLAGHTLPPIEVHDSLRLAVVLPLVFGGALNMLPDSYQGKERRAHIFFFVNSNSFGHFIRFWVFVAIVAFVSYAISLYNFPYKHLFEYIDFAVLVAGYVCFVITLATVGKLLVRPRD